ncbi:MAG: DUF3810 domain-containing protein [Oscillospiraceae bacterium]|nr:DUF3810 domain-containing protein [Oscillospiraceae bacterium]
MIKKLKKPDIALIIGFSAMLLLNMIARLSHSFSDFYVQKIFPVISLPLMRLSDLFPFALGEWLIAIGVAIVLLGIPSLITFFIVKRNNKPLRRRIGAFALRFVLWVALYIFITETLNCFIMYQCSTFSSRYFKETEHTEELLLDTLEAVALQVADLHDNFTRDEDGYIALNKDYRPECISAMKNTASLYSQLSGYYPTPKPIYNSFFMSQEGVIGLYMPFTMEATFNQDTQDIAKPATICHELAHLKGIIQEDEANFVSMVVCFLAEDEAVKYSGYLDALYYLYADAKNLVGTEYEDEYYRIISIVPAVVWSNDIASFKADYWQKNEDKEIIPTETVEAVSEALTDATLQLNGVKDGILSYYRVVELLMDYYASGGTI